MLSCVLVAEHKSFRRVVGDRLSSFQASIGLPVKLCSEVGCPTSLITPELLIIDYSADGKRAWLSRRDYLRQFTGIIVVSERPIDVFERETFGLHIDSVIRLDCPQVIFNNAVLRAIRRRNAEFAAETQKAEEQLIRDMILHAGTSW